MMSTESARASLAGTDKAVEIAVRPLREEDLRWFRAVRNSAADFLHDQRRFTSAEVGEWFFREDRPDIEVIEVERQQIGFFRLVRINESVLQVGADLDPEFQGRGLGFEAYRQSLPVFADRYGVNEFTLRVLPMNIRAIRLYLSLGFQTVEVCAEYGPGRTVSVRDLEMRRDAATYPVPTAPPNDFARLLVAGLDV